MNTILIVDDNALSRQSLRSVFEEHGDWRVAEAGDGKEGVLKAAELKPDLVVLDFAMPEMNGFEAATLMKRAAPQLPLILFTAYTDEFLEKQAYETGFSAVVTKRGSTRRLIEWVQALIKHRSSHAACTGTPERQEIIGEGRFREPKTAVIDPRRYRRLKLEAPATLYSDRHGLIPARLADISECGFAAILPIELSIGEIVNAELNFPFGARRVQVVVRNRRVFRHGFETVRTVLSEEMTRLAEKSQPNED